MAEVSKKLVIYSPVIRRWLISQVPAQLEPYTRKLLHNCISLEQIMRYSRAAAAAAEGEIATAAAGATIYSIKLVASCPINFHECNLQIRVQLLTSKRSLQMAFILCFYTLSPKAIRIHWLNGKFHIWWMFISMYMEFIYI